MPIGTFRVPQGQCPVCHKRLDGASNLTEDSPPKPGDLSICVYCGTVLQFSENLQFKIATDEIIESLKGNGGYDAMMRFQKNVNEFLSQGRKVSAVEVALTQEKRDKIGVLLLEAMNRAVDLGYSQADILVSFMEQFGGAMAQSRMILDIQGKISTELPALAFGYMQTREILNGKDEAKPQAQ